MTTTDSSHEDDRRGGIVRRVLSPGANPEERLEELLDQQAGASLDAHAEQLHASIAELERREELLRDSRASVERMLRLRDIRPRSREQEPPRTCAS